MHIPASIQTITSIHTTDQGVRSGTFSYAEGLQNIYVDPANANYTDIDGVLYSKDGKTLVQFPAGRSGSCTIPAGVTAIGPGAFYSTHLTSLELPASMASTLATMPVSNTAARRQKAIWPTRRSIPSPRRRIPVSP
ncbi:hypothetical protein [uncultured Allobaculum sp.]|uniref:hypothetical protein n=1 Tax=uncultured Allobaculum sp. TaxID=1187017 RepID=UPI002634CDFB|nr:hypothetical protein [uncultured Allobaculum sp.]